MAEKEKTAGPPRVLVAAGSAAQAISFVSWLKHEGFEVMTAIDGQEALQLAGSSWQPDVVLFDLTLPRVNVSPLFERVRATNRAAVLFALSGDSEEEEVRSLEAGADDYLAQPFSPEVLLARIQAHLRRAHLAGNQRILEAGDLRLDTKNYATWVKGEWIDLRPQEFRLLAALAQSSGVPLSRQELARRTGTSWRGASSRTVDMNVSRIRACVETPSEYTYIHSVRGFGYRFEAVAKEAPSRASPLEQRD
jgi:DNA-binding response OmpR family regulator